MLAPQHAPRRRLELRNDGRFPAPLFSQQRGKKLYKWAHYFDVYERHFARFRGQAPTMLEIGVAGGGSLAMWKAYFGPGARIIGVDVQPHCKEHESEGIEIFIGSQDDPALIEQIFAKYPNIDIVLDDGSHQMHHVMASFQLLYDRINPNGVYMVEDLHTAYWDEFGGGHKRPGTFIEHAKDLIDAVNAVHARDAVPVSEFTRSTHAISFYDSIVAFEKAPQGRRFAPTSNAMGLDTPKA